MDMFILAEITSKMDPSGVFCLASIVFLLIAFIAYSTGPIGGSCTCLIFFVIAVFGTGDSKPVDGGLQYRPNPAFITNRSQTKMISRYKYSINHKGCYFTTPISRGFGEDTIFIPAEEIEVIDGIKCMRSTGKSIDPFGDDGYLWFETIDPINASKDVGGWGVPQWVYHPASPVYIFGIAGLPALIGGSFIAKKIRG